MLVVARKTCGGQEIMIQFVVASNGVHPTYNDQTTAHWTEKS